MSLVESREQLVFFPCGDISLAGILTVPVRPNGATVLIPWGSATYPSSGKNRVRTRLARTIALQGFHSFRFDYRGVGESEGEYRKPDLGRPNTEEVLAACDWLNGQGLSRIIVVAHCFGGWSSLMAARMISGLEGMAVVNSPVRRDHKEALAGNWRWWISKILRIRLKKLMSRKHRAAYREIVASKASSLKVRRSRSPTLSGTGSKDSFSGAITYLLEKRIPVLLLYGDDDFRLDLEAELEQGLRAAIDAADRPTRVVAVAERLALADLAAQDSLQSEVLAWLRDIPPRPS